MSALVGKASSAFVETPADLLIKKSSARYTKEEGKNNQGNKIRKCNPETKTSEQIGFHGADGYPVTIYNFIMTVIV